MAKTWDQIRNAQVIEMRRNNARIAINSLRYHRKHSDNLSRWGLLSVEFRVQELIALYRQTNKVLCKNI
jgi:hypothetical protein